jgi:nucleotide-binding universal stress UspA family protein
MYKHILVAVDESDTSNLALHEAMKLAKEQHAALRLVHVVDETPAYMTMDTAFALGDFQKAMREAGQKVLATCAATARQAGVEVDTKFIVLQTQRICDAIIEEAKRWPADLIVIGTHGRHGFNHLLLGSVAEGVIRLATSPVLAIRGVEQIRQSSRPTAK